MSVVARLARRLPAAAAAALLAASIATAPAAADVTWLEAAHVPGVFDVAGPRSDGRLVLAGSGGLFLLDTAGGPVERFAGGPGGYSGAPAEEAYIALSPGPPPGGCVLAGDDVLVLQLKPAGGILRVDATGHASAFASVPGVSSLNGIAFDGSGRFGHRLLVTGPAPGGTVVAAVDCRGTVEVLTRRAPVMEGGIAVAPPGFGRFAGDLVSTDELSGTIYATAPDGSTAVVTSRTGLATGGDIGVEGAGFIPPGDVASATAYFADRATPGSPHPGTDELLALPGTSLAAAGARPGDLVAATEGGAGMVGVHCDAGSCRPYAVVADNGVSHGEGHVVVVRAAAGAPPRTAADARLAPAGPPVVAIVAGAAAGLALAIAATALALRRRRRRAPAR